MLDDKYLVIKRASWEATRAYFHRNPNYLEFMDHCENDLLLDDVAVLRLTDAFAGPALHTYATNMALVAELMKDLDARKSEDLLRIADRLQEKAERADDLYKNGKSKLPD